MRFLSISLMATALTQSAGFSPAQQRQRHSRFTTPWSSRQQNLCPRFDTAVFGSADALLRMVEEVSNGQFSPEIVEKMSELEQALTAFLEEEKASKQNTFFPRPPEIPPPLKSFIKEELTREERDKSLIKAEQALETLRQRLRQEEETLRRAEEALQKSMEEQEVLRRAEEALAKSRAAAEERKADAIRRTEEAVASAEKARKEKQLAEQLAREHGWFGGSTDTTYVTQSRPTISLLSLDENNNVGDDVDDSKVRSAPVPSDAPSGIPVLFDWVQYIDGSITGRVRGSRNFQDGSKISTSPVPDGAKVGMVITTASGSKYYLDKAPNKESETYTNGEELNGFSNTVELIGGHVNGNSVGTFRQETDSAKRSQEQSVKPNGISLNTPKKMVRAPPGVPSILNWEILEDGGIAGLIYGSTNAEDGDYVETSPIATGSIESGYVVKTSSGSSYFLSPDQTEKQENVMAAFKDLAAARRGGTITITKDMKEKNAQEALERLEAATSRSTFSLNDLFGARDASGKRQPNENKAPSGIPTLSRWSTNEDGTITGVVYGSPTINDGDLVTTSPIVEGEMKEDAMVTTVSGSVYYLE